MNYRHAFHAGNVGDVLKHMALVAILRHLTAKAKPLWVMDVHAGAGLYALTGEEAQRSPEWRQGIARLWPLRGATLPEALGRYLDAIAAVNPAHDLHWYPGSPALAQSALRSGDRLTLCEVHGPTAARLAEQVGSLRRAAALKVSVLPADGYERLVGLVPPPEKRGVVLIDPAYEASDEWDQALAALARARRRWATGCFVLWMPLKDATEDGGRMAALGTAVQGPLTGDHALSLSLSRPASPTLTGLRGSRVVILNPPWRLAEQMREALPIVAAALDPAAGYEATVQPGLG